MIVALLLATAAVPQDPAPKPAPEQATVVFSGRESLSEGRLTEAAKAELQQYREEGGHARDVDDAAFLMELLYRQEGFPEATVRWEIAAGADGTELRFSIREGKRLRLGGLRFPGATALTPEQLAGLIGAEPEGEGDRPYRVADLKRLRGAIIDAYWGLGHLEATVGEAQTTLNADGTRMDASFAIDEGVGYVVQAVAIREAGPLGEPMLAPLGTPLLGKPYFPRRKAELAAAIRRLHARMAYPEAKPLVEADLDRETGAVTLVVTVDAGARTRIAGIEVEGVDRTEPDFIRKRMKLEAEEPFDRDRIDEGYLRLFRTGLFRTIAIALGESEDPTLRPLTITVEEALAKELSLRGGYGSYEGVRLGVGYLERNLFGTGRRLRGNLDASEVGWALETGWTDPWLFESEVELDVPVFLRRRKEPSFTREEAGLGLNLSREMRPGLRLSGGWSFRRSSVSAVEVTARPGEIVDDFDIATLFVQPEYDDRDDPFNPTRGRLARLRVERAGESLVGGDLSFVRANLALAQLAALDRERDTVLALGWRAGLAWPFGGTDALPLQERFFNGGEDTVRSFKEGELGPLDANREPRGGESFHVANLELRRRLMSSLWAGAFVDAGNVGDRAGDLFDDLKLGTGVGLRYLIPVGALRLDVAWNPDRDPGEDRYRVILTVGMAF